jgi:phenylpyruvate tautomerase PptA (4-oxalocrotonate tautomerase family)
MPWMEVTILKSETAVKQQLLERLNREFIDATGFEDEVLYIRFSEFEKGDFGKSGSFADADVANVLVYCPRLRFDVKRSLASGLTNAFEGTGMKPFLYIMEFPYENIAVDGQLLTDADEELASRPFYYVIPH